jgi:hypothetical protein
MGFAEAKKYHGHLSPEVPRGGICSFYWNGKCIFAPRPPRNIYEQVARPDGTCTVGKR